MKAEWRFGWLLAAAVPVRARFRLSSFRATQTESCGRLVAGHGMAKAENDALPDEIKRLDGPLCVRNTSRGPRLSQGPYPRVFEWHQSPSLKGNDPAAISRAIRLHRRGDLSNGN